MTRRATSSSNRRSFVCKNNARSGSWHASNRRYPERDETRDLLTAWIEHGAAPQGAKYAYAVVPGIEREEVAGYAAKVPVV